MRIHQKAGIVMLVIFSSLSFSAMPALAQTSNTQFINCPALSSNLFRGLRDIPTDGQVSELQRFLASLGYYQPVTGYYGVLTYGNLIRFQRAHGISATGYFGPLTRGAINRMCIGSPQQNNISITNISGPVSLPVGQSGTWSIVTNAPVGSDLSVSINWGDQRYYYPASAQNISQANTFSHTYSSTGTYTITFTVTD